jgi:RNA ligase
MMAGEDLDATRRDLPEEMLADFDTIRRLLGARLEALVDEVLAAAERVKDLSDKELGLMLKGPGHGLSDLARDFLFACRKCDFRAAARTKGRVRDGLLRRCRPDGNRLEGYTPSSLVTRFQSESH